LSEAVNKKERYMLRATKIIATLGPASEKPEVLRDMIRAGLDVVRLNFSHGTVEDHRARHDLVRSICAEVGRELGIMADLQGPKIRVGKFVDGKVMLTNGAKFVLDASRTELGDLQGVGLDYKELPRDVKPGDLLLLNDGLIVLTVEAVRGEQVHTCVKVGGELSNNKGINKQGGGLTAPALTGKDMEDIKTAMSFQADYVAVSFPKNATDMEMARQLAIFGILLITSKGAAGVTGSGFIVLASTLTAIKVIPLEGLALLIGVDRFMSEARSVTNFIGNAVATVVISKHEKAIDMDTFKKVVGV